MPVLRDPRSGVVVHVDDGTAAALRWPSADDVDTSTDDDTDADEADDEPDLACDQCGFVGKTAAGLKSHLRAHA